MQKIFILHGWSQEKNNRLKWEPFINQLKQNKINSEFLQIPGLDSKINRPWLLQDYMNWLKTKLPKNQKIILLGHSFGGQISTLYTSQNPNKVKKLILLDSSGIINKSLDRKIKQLIFYPLAKIGKIFFKDQKYRKLLYKIAREHDYEKADFNLRKTFINVKKTEIINNAKSITCPTLIIWGLNDKITPIYFAHLFNQSIKNSKLYFIKEARHSPQFTHSQKVASLICDFLSK